MTMQVLRFTADWCGPCSQYAPTFERVANMNEFDDIDFKVFDVEQNSEEAAKYNIRSIPATVILRDGLVADSVNGNMPEETLVKLIKEA